MDFSSVIGFLKEWQTLMTGIIAIASAVATVYILSKQRDTLERQLQSQQHRDKVQNQRNSIAGRAELPIALSNLLYYLDDCVDYLISMEYNDDNTNSRRPILPTDAIEKLKLSILYIDTHSGESLREIIAQLQILDSRLRQDRAVSRQGPRREYLFHIAQIATYLELSLPFARNEEEQINFDDIKQQDLYLSFRNRFQGENRNYRDKKSSDIQSLVEKRYPK